ncbi:hypothetical protein [Terriglobus sp. ADX1]|uniref:hypothetical protein n=1 Tax=Terriglobus sp. ADX1 TaxID=2794063 RepID=UPI002FE5A601
MNRAMMTMLLLSGSSLLAQQAQVAPPLELSLRCTSVQTAEQSRVVKSAAYGFGNPTNPDSDQNSAHVDRTVLVELKGSSGRVYLPKAVLAEGTHATVADWFPLENIVATPDFITGTLRLTAAGQSVRLNRRTGGAELTGYGRETLRGTCHVNSKPQQF